jgi:hypothetical protein
VSCNKTSASGLSTDEWLVHCPGGCTNPANWSETHVARPFNEKLAPAARGYFIGDYEGLASIGNDFSPFFVQAGPVPGQSDAYFAKLGP